MFRLLDRISCALWLIALICFIAMPGCQSNEQVITALAIFYIAGGNGLTLMALNRLLQPYLLQRKVNKLLRSIEESTRDLERLTLNREGQDQARRLLAKASAHTGRSWTPYGDAQALADFIGEGFNHVRTARRIMKSR